MAARKMREIGGIGVWHRGFSFRNQNLASRLPFNAGRRRRPVHGCKTARHAGSRPPNSLRLTTIWPGGSPRRGGASTGRSCPGWRCAPTPVGRTRIPPHRDGIRGVVFRASGLGPPVLAVVSRTGPFPDVPQQVRQVPGVGLKGTDRGCIPIAIGALMLHRPGMASRTLGLIGNSSCRQPTVPSVAPPTVAGRSPARSSASPTPSGRWLRTRSALPCGCPARYRKVLPAQRR